MAAAALAVSVLALILSGWAAVSSHRQARSAERTTKAAEDHVAMLRASEEAAANRTPWRIDHYQDYRYLLANIGGTTCYDVALTGDDFHRLDPMVETIFGPDESATFFAISSSVGRASRLKVHWADRPGGRKKEWMGTLPPRAQRRE